MALQYGTGEHITIAMEGPFAGGGMASKLTSITLPVANWKGAESPYTQVVDVPEVSVNSKVELQLDVSQLVNRTAFTATNVGGVVTVKATGDKPTIDYTIQATIMEVVA